MNMLAMLRQENQQLRVEQAEMMDAMKFQRASLEAKVHDLQQELEQQMFRTPESGDTVKRHLEMTVGEQEKEVDLEKERKRLYELTPMQQFEQLQSLMGTPAPGNRGGRGRGQRERSRSLQGPRTSGPTEEQTKGSIQPEPRPMKRSSDRRSVEKGLVNLGGDLRQPSPLSPKASGSQDGVKGEKMMEAMAKLVNHLVEKESRDGAPESVKPGTVTLPTLPEPADSAPIDLADWLTLIEPAMTDLSDSSGQWWELVVDEARKWYSHYIHLRPLQRATCVIEPSLELQKPKWVRVEKRAISMMLAAVPTSVKEELVATRALSPLRLVSKLMVLYQPGGTHERSIILRQLEEPSEATSPAEACAGLRKWMRWLRRASDIGLNLPDSTILMKGIMRLSQKVLAQQPDLQFRCSLVRNTLQLDTIPTEETVKTYAEHLLAELEQLMHRVRPKTAGAPRAGNQGGGPEVKAAFVDENKGEGNPDGKSPGICKYFRTDGGCRRGAACRWQHQAEPGEKRCYVCGATNHYAKDCTRKETKKAGASGGDGGKGDGKRPDPERKIQKVKDVGGASSSAPSETSSSVFPNPGSPPSTCGSDLMEGGNQDALKQVLDEAQRMLRGMSLQGEKSKEADLVEALRKIKEGPTTPTMKAVSVARVQWTQGQLMHYDLDDRERTWSGTGKFKCRWPQEDDSPCE